MNYRHAYHAGNFADVFKHSLFARVLTCLKQKDKPFRVIDTHAGVGVYRLDGEEARKTLEAQAGWERLRDTPLGAQAEAVLEPYRESVRFTHDLYGQTAYPGSPLIALSLMRASDRAVFCELHSEDVDQLQTLVRRDKRVKALHLDGWMGLRANIPPVERRGVVIIDPPFEQPGEMLRLAEEMVQAALKWPTGIYMGWYPIKDMAVVEKAATLLASSAIPKILRLELYIRSPADTTRLNGCGFFIINPPWMLEEEAQVLLKALSERLSQASGSGFRCTWLKGE